MFGSTTLDVAIGLVFIYLLYSLFATILQELIATFLFNLRAKVLEFSIVRMLEDKSRLSRYRIINIFQILFSNIIVQPGTLSEKFYKHPLIKFLGEDNTTRKISYMTSNTFSKVLLDLLRGKDIKPGDDIKDRIMSTLEKKKIPGEAGIPIDQETHAFLNSIWVDAQGDISKFTVMLEQWFDETMKRATGWYKKYTQIILLVIGLVFAMGFNINTIEIVHKLERDPALREQMVAQADNFLKAHPNLDKELALALKEDTTNVQRSDTASLHTLTTQTRAQYDALKARRDTLLNTATRLLRTDMEKTNNLLGLGWNDWCDFFHTATHSWSIIGWLMTAIAISLGAPFWFDLLNKMMKLRSSVAINSNDKKNSAAGESSETGKILIERKG